MLETVYDIHAASKLPNFLRPLSFAWSASWAVILVQQFTGSAFLNILPLCNTATFPDQQHLPLQGYLARAAPHVLWQMSSRCITIVTYYYYSIVNNNAVWYYGQQDADAGNIMASRYGQKIINCMHRRFTTPDEYVSKDTEPPIEYLGNGTEPYIFYEACTGYIYMQLV